MKKYFAIEWDENIIDFPHEHFWQLINCGVDIIEIQPHCGHPTAAIDPAGFCRMCEAEAECSEP